MASWANITKSRLGIVGLWRLNETSGVVASDKTATKDGTYTGGPTLGAAGAQADGDLAVTLDGATQYVTMGSVATLRPTAAISVETIFKPAVVNVARQSIAGCGSTTKGYLLCLENAVLKFYVNGTAVAAATSLLAGGWYYVTATYDGANLKIYINGRLQGTQALTGAVDYTGITDFMIGQRHGVIAGEYLNATVDECAAYTRALLASEIIVHQSGRASRGPAYALHAELNGINNGWTDLTADLFGEEQGQQGLPGSTVKDRVASTGELHFTLNNSAKNSVGLQGRYSPDHVNKVAGWDYGIRVRWAITAGQTTWYRHVGTIDEIDAEAGIFEGQAVRVTSLDYMDEIARTNVSNVTVQVQQSDSVIFSALIASLPKQPAAIQVGAGLDTFAYALDNVKDEETKLMSIMQDLAMSGLSLIYVKSGTTGDVLVYETRSYRAQANTVLDSFDDTMFVSLEPSRARGNAVNRAKAISHPKRIDATATTAVFDLPAGNFITIAPGDTVTYFGPYTDPANLGARIGATAVVSPLVATTNYLMNTASDGTGADISASLDTTGTAFFGNTAMFVLKNNGAITGYVTKLRAFGKGVYDYSPVVAQAEDAASQGQAGVNQQTIDMIYQSDPKVASEVAYYIVNIFKDPRTAIKKVGFKIPSHDDVLALRVLRRQISDRVGISETVTGLKTSTSYFINWISTMVDANNNLEVEWLLAPADQTQYWLLEVTGRSELDQTTRLGFGLIVGHTDVAHGDIAHIDDAHADVAHADSHTDDAHQDHSDAAHTDVPHGDSVHSDRAHTDTAHSDVAHGDVAHSDDHSDVAHSDVAHADTTSHTDHTDHVHVDQNNHGDSHTDVAHADSHQDVVHTDTAHTDVAHADISHLDVAHSDAAHADVASGHSDVLHGDVAHTDAVHSDVAHGDVAHTDTAHGDAN